MLEEEKERQRENVTDRQTDGRSGGPTCAVASAVEVDAECSGLVLGLPGGRGAVLVVGVGVVVVHVLPRQHGGARRAAHRRGHKGVGEVGATLLHDAAGLIHGLHGP